jgi:hypothetical protein
MLTCPNCGYDNELGRIFCHSCGQKLDLSAIKPPNSKEGKKFWKKQKKQFGVGKTIGLALRVLVILGLVLSIILMLQVASVTEEKPSQQDTDSGRSKRVALERFLSQRKPFSVPVSPGELNGFLSSLTFDKAEGKGVVLEPTVLRAELGRSTVTLVLVGTIKAGTKFEKKVSFSYRGQPTLEDGKFVFKPTGGWIGMLPIHPFILDKTGLMQKYFGAIFGNLTEERSILDQLTKLEVEPERVLLEYQPAGSK